MKLRNPFITPSTRAFFDEARKVPDYSFFDLLHGYVYGRWTYLYIDIGVGEHPLAKWYVSFSKQIQKWFPKKKRDESDKSQNSMADTYHGKAIPLETAKQLVTINEEIQIPDLEQVIPYKRARSIIMKNPDRIVAIDCPCRSARENPCLPMDVCLVVGDPFASFVREHQPERSRWITRDEAISILQAEDERGHVHHAFFKDAMLNRFYAICNCCECCCGAMHAHHTGTPMLASSGFVAQVDDLLCNGCSNCNTYCQFNALEVMDGVNYVNYEKCMGCGVCVSKCDYEAISLVSDESKGIPLEINALMDEAIRAAQADAALHPAITN